MALRMVLLVVTEISIEMKTMIMMITAVVKVVAMVTMVMMIRVGDGSGGW